MSYSLSTIDEGTEDHLVNELPEGSLPSTLAAPRLAKRHSTAHSYTSLPKHIVEHPRTVGAWGLGLLTFFNVSGGPFGSEPIVSSAGPFPGFCMLFAMALMWGLPLSLVTSEMSAALPNNGGYVLWVDVAFGRCFAF
jgi:hypothetical protein